MRKITSNACVHFQARTKFSSGNTHTDGNSLYLHGNAIARYDEFNALWVSCGGWSSMTTKERLNGLVGVSVTQKKGVWYLNGKEWCGEWVRVSDYFPVLVPVDSNPWE